MTWKEKLTIPALIVSALLALGTILGWFGTDVVTQSDKFEQHTKYEINWHQTDSLTDEQVEERINELHNHAISLQSLAEGMVRGECLENTKSNLSRQGLILKCRELGIEPPR